MRRRQGPLAPLAALAVMVAVTAGCTNDAGPGPPDTAPDTTAAETPTTQQATTTTTVTDEQAAYNVYRQFLDASLDIGRDFARSPDDGSLDPYTTPTYRAAIVRNLEGLKRNGITQRGNLTTRLLGSEAAGDTLKLRVCRRDDVDQFDRTGKQLTPPGLGVPEVAEVSLVRQGTAIWLLDNLNRTGEPCDV